MCGAPNAAAMGRLVNNIQQHKKRRMWWTRHRPHGASGRPHTQRRGGTVDCVLVYTGVCCGLDAALAGRAVDRTDRDLQCEASWLRVRSLRVAKVYGGFLNLGRIAGSLWRPLGACQGIW